MTSDEKLAMLFRIVGKIELRLDAIEGNQRNAESGTTACSAAGGGIEQVKTARSAGWEPCLIEVRDFLRKRRDTYVSMHIGDYHGSQVFELESILEWIDERIIEARR